ncbi:metallophosphoesterase family protein [Tundrisphaera sp. TA3]|uniref:metallophosphoesterase family protein n=1 Tax=Tundrisphaera sp. TA3 TaxID=3435775 RepID=UPI003EC07C90
MKLGIVSDIHEAVELLDVALAGFRRAGVDRVVTLGDLFETGPRLERTVELLEAAGAVGVYGNHDHGLCVDPSPFALERYSRRVFDYMATLLPRMEIDGFLLAHREPWLDCREITDIWHADERPLTPDLIARSFDATPHHAILIGHFHRWLALDRRGPLPWDGREPFRFRPEAPTMMVVHAVCDGYAAILDTGTGRLDPLDLYADAGWARPQGRPLPVLCDHSEPRTAP